MSKTQAGPRLFTLAEAQKMLPLVRSIVSDIVERYARFKMRVEAFRLAQAGRGDESSPAGVRMRDRMKQEIEELKDQVMAVVGELGELGADLREYEEGMVDFPARLGEEIVYLSWKLGEPRIAYWRPLDGTDSPRRSLEELHERSI
jgi:hypothetical protein